MGLASDLPYILRSCSQGTHNIYLAYWNLRQTMITSKAFSWSPSALHLTVHQRYTKEQKNQTNLNANAHQNRNRVQITLLNLLLFVKCYRLRFLLIGEFFGFAVIKRNEMIVFCPTSDVPVFITSSSGN